jgi:hypothetical protein
MFCIAPGEDGVSSDISEKKVRGDSLVGKKGSWNDRGCPKVSWGSGWPSKAKRSRLDGRHNPCILRADTDDQILKILTTQQSTATASMEKSPKPIKLDSEAIPTSWWS